MNLGTFLLASKIIFRRIIVIFCVITFKSLISSPLAMDTGKFYYSNKTKYDIKDETLRYTWAGFFLFALISSLSGDTIILIASIKYKVFKLNKLIIVIIQHIAVCDLLVSLTSILPRFVSVAASAWLFGDFLCYFTAYTGYYFNPASMLLICIMTSTKLFLLQYPLRSGVITTARAHMFCALCWLVSLTFPISFLLVDKDDVYFSYRTYQCDYACSTTTTNVWQWLKPTLALTFAFLPTCQVMITTVFLLVKAKQVAQRQSLKWQGILTVILVAAVYCLSVLPIFSYHIAVPLVISGEDLKSKPFFGTTYYRAASSFVTLNTISNFYIYSLTVPSFREFVWSRIRLRSNRISSQSHMTSHDVTSHD